ncbi:MAG: TonB-dependent receptor, partial [Bacteroidota bacterium]|nr:TonB-dependent receptor [Bacteroidota bacterium]
SGITVTTLMGRTGSYGGQINGINLSAYAQLDHDFGKLNVSTGSRYEYFDLDSVFVGKPVFRGGLNYELSKGFNIRSSFGQGFRFPTITELFMQGDIGPVNLYNNPNLKPESGWTAEIGLKKVLKIDDYKGYIDLVGFVMEYDNMMEFTFGQWGNPLIESLGGIGFSSRNVGKTRIPGLELTLNGAGAVGENWNVAILSGVTVSRPFSVYPDSIFATNYFNNVGYTFNNTSSDTANSILKYRNTTTARFDFEVIYKNRLTVGFSHQYNSKIRNIDGVFTTDLFNTESAAFGTIDIGVNRSMEALNHGYHLFDFRLKYNINDTLMLGFLCENLLNKSYLIRPAYMGSPRTYMFQLKKEF